MHSVGMQMHNTIPLLPSEAFLTECRHIAELLNFEKEYGKK